MQDNKRKIKKPLRESVMTLKESLKVKLKNVLDPELINQLPSRYPLLGPAILIRLKDNLIPFKETIGEAILEIHKKAKSVWLFRKPAKGIFREPKIECIAGDCNPIIFHKELKTKFIIDISKLIFSPGNAGERQRLVNIIGENETVMDLFACCGNLSLPIAVNKNIKRLIAVEANSYAFSFLLMNIKLNKVNHIVSPYLLDNHYWSTFNIADHVLLGFLPAPDIYQVEIGVRALKDSGGILHYHWISEEDRYREELKNLVGYVESLSREVKVLEIRRIKSVAPKKIHFVARLHVRK